MAISSEWIPQGGVIPIRNGRICLVQSSSGVGWGIPKGRMEKSHTAGETALREAWEEAGLSGTLSREPVGSYRYEKLGQQFHVVVFLMDVTEVSDKWPESSWRRRRWLLPSQVLRNIPVPGLRKLMRKFLARELAETVTH